MTWNDLTAEERAIAHNTKAYKFMTMKDLSEYWIVAEHRNDEEGHTKAILDYMKKLKARNGVMRGSDEE